MSIAIRNMRPDELSYVQNMDLKCFDYTWEPDEWEIAVEAYEVKVAHHYNTPVAFAVFAIFEQRYGKVTHFFKLGVKPNFRKRGISRLLVNEVIRCSNEVGAKYIEAVIPESICDPANPLCISPWLSKVGFKAELPILKDYIANFGMVEDAFRFQHQLRK
jgi:GNAT superfamily N-acetyltransferase